MSVISQNPARETQVSGNAEGRPDMSSPRAIGSCPGIGKARALLLQILAFLIYYSGLIRLLRFLGRHDTKILLYHSVDETENVFVGGMNMNIPPDLFERHIEYVLSHYEVIPLRKLVDSLRTGETLTRCCVITFDDGFADIYRHAYPKLRKSSIPACIFLNTDCVDGRSMNWLQELSFLVNTVGAAGVCEAMTSIPIVKGNGFRSNGGSPERDLHRRLQDYLTYSVDKKRRNEILDELFQRMGIRREAIPGSSGIFLNWKQVGEMREHGITFGNHGKTHTPLSAMTHGDMEQELIESRRILEENLETDFIPFAYPFGQKMDIPEDSADLVRRLGHNAALTAKPARNHSGISPFELGRIPVSNVSVYMFAFEMEKETLKHLLRWNSRHGT